MRPGLEGETGEFSLNGWGWHEIPGVLALARQPRHRGDECKETKDVLKNGTMGATMYKQTDTSTEYR